MVENIARAVMAADWPTARVSALAGARPLQAETSEAEGPAATPEADPGHGRPVLLNGLMPIDVEKEIANENRVQNDDIEDRRRWNVLRWTGVWPEEHATVEPQVFPDLGPWTKATPPQEENRAVRTLRPQEKEWRRLQRRKPRPQEEELNKMGVKRSVLRCRRIRIHWSGNDMC